MIVITLSVVRMRNVVLMGCVLHWASVVAFVHVLVLAIPNAVMVSSAVHHLILVVLMAHAPDLVSHAVALAVYVTKIMNVVLMVHVFHRASVVGLVTVDPVKGVVVEGVFYQICVVMT